MRTPITVGVVGLGYWGPNLARVFADLSQVELRWLCDASPEIQLAMRTRYPGVRTTPELDDLLGDELLDAVVIATPVATHFELARRVLEADKHVFVEKPLALSSAQGEELVRLAEARNRRLMVGHVLLFHPAVRRLKELIDAGHLGDIYYLYGNRQNLGKVRRDENALWSLGAHDVAVMLYLLGDQPIEVSARGESYVQPGVADVVFCYLQFATGISSHMHLSWLDPHKMRRLTAVGSQRMAVFDDMELERKLTVYEKSAAPRTTDTYGEYVQVRFGDIISPRLPNDEPLRIECEQFVASIRSGIEIPAGGREGLAVVRVLEALQRSLESGGRGVPLAGEAPERRVVALPLKAAEPGEVPLAVRRD
jgi:predicted dehydrogenase